jgi:hypothetical protein
MSVGVTKDYKHFSGLFFLVHLGGILKEQVSHGEVEILLSTFFPHLRI